MTPLSTRALAAAQAVARAHGLPTGAMRVLGDRANLVVHLAPAPVIARVATTVARGRPDVQRWMARSAEVVAFAAAHGAPVVPPVTEVPTGPHEHDGLLLVFERWVDHDADATPSARELGTSLRDLHRVLGDYPDELPYLTPLFGHAYALLDVIGDVLLAADIARLRDAFDQLREQFVPRAGDQTLHGDSQVDNVLMTPEGLLWNDFEDACRGPVQWDVAVLARRLPGAETFYDDSIDPESLVPYVHARLLQGVVWEACLATQRPENTARAHEALAGWLALSS